MQDFFLQMTIVSVQMRMFQQTMQRLLCLQVICLMIYTLTEHLIRNICTPAYSCNYPVSQSCGSSAMHKIMQINEVMNKVLGECILAL